MTTNFLSSSCFANHRILVTGASSGIGRATAILLSQCGAQITISGRNPERLGITLDMLQGTGHQTSLVALSDADSVADWVKSLAMANEPFDGIFHAAGIVKLKPIRLLKQTHLDEVMGSSLMASFGIARAAAQKGVMKDGASIVYMSSVASSRGQVANSAYSAAKSAIESLTRSLACEMAPRRIRVNAIASGAVETEMHVGLINQMGETNVENYASQHLLGFGTPLDIAYAAAFLLSPVTPWITGTTIVVDGGYMVR